nr:MAG TPA: hypothetical protein [Caudoviricetes sp.]
MVTSRKIHDTFIWHFSFLNNKNLFIYKGLTVFK